jgi:hypothetical protein
MTTPTPSPEPVRPAPPDPTSTPVRGTGGDTLNVIPLVIGAIGAIAVFVSSFLAWFSFEGPDGSLNGTSVPVEFLWNTSIGGDGPSLLVALGPMALLIILGAIFGQARVLAIVGGVLAIVVAVLFVIQTSDLLDDLRIDEGTFDALGIGPYIAFGGGAVGIFAGLVPRTD